MTPVPPAAVDWAATLAEQLDAHWRGQLRPRMETLTDEEYFWEPVPDCWNLRPRQEATTPMAAGAGALRLDFAIPTPSPAPVTTIAWRLCHLLVGIFGMRNHTWFGGAAIDYRTAVYPATAAAALHRLDVEEASWIAGVRGLSAAQLATPVGSREPYPDVSMAGLVLHINREVIHHAAEISLLRDLFLRRRH